MKSLLILGKGFIGSNLSQYLNQHNLEHEIYSKSMMDYTNKDILKQFLNNNGYKYHAVVNTSGYTGTPNVDGCEENKKLCWEYNVSNILKIVDICNSEKLPVINVGSGCIYNGYDKEYTEDDEPNFGLFSDDSSYYSKCKHASELLLDDTCVYILRIRIPFTYQNTSKNYLTKLLKYNNLIDKANSVTSVTDFNNFLYKFAYILQEIPGGIYNVVNSGSVKASDVVDIFKQNNIENKNWNYIEVEDLKTKAKRSNCVLSTDKLKKINLQLPPAIESLERDIKIFKNFL